MTCEEYELIHHDYTLLMFLLHLMHLYKGIVACNKHNDQYIYIQYSE